MKYLVIPFLVSLLFIANSCQNNKNNMVEKFDFKAYEERTKNNSFDERAYTKEDGTIVEESDGNTPTIWETPPKPTFVKIYKEFYKNGKLKKQFTLMGERLKIDTSVYYGIFGCKIVVDENKKFGKIKPNDILKFLEDKGRINLQTGEGVFDWKGGFAFRIVYQKNKNIWYITIPEGRLYTPDEMHIIMSTLPFGEPNEWKSFEYAIDGTTGELISSNEDEILKIGMKI